MLDLQIPDGSTDIVITARHDMQIEVGEHIEEAMLGHEWSTYLLTWVSGLPLRFIEQNPRTIMDPTYL